MDPTRLNAFVDRELALEQQLEIEALLRDEPSLRTEVEALTAVRDAVRQQSDYHTAPAALRAQLSGPAARPASTDRARTPAWRLGWAALAGAVAGAALTLAVTLVGLPARPDDALVQEAVAAHVRASLSQHRIDMASSERHTVKPWLSARLDYSPPVPALQRPGLRFEGARLDYLDGRAVAVLVYAQGAHQVDAFVRPSRRQAPTPVLTVDKGFRIAQWSRDGMTWCVVSDLNAQEFAALVGDLEAGAAGL
jgi:anti-sigma factor RsiW